MENGKKIVIIGATSSIAEQCARLWAKEKPSEFILVGRDRLKTEIVASDLRVRTPNTKITVFEVAFNDPDSIQALAVDIGRTAPIDIVLIAHGSLSDQKQCQEQLRNCKAALEINGISPVIFAEAFASTMGEANHGTLAIIGSVAGDRGRKSNYIYGSAKGMIHRYVQGLQHRFAESQVNVVLIKPGPTDTPMTADLKRKGQKLASAERVAEEVVAGIARRKTVVYAPAKWIVIMMVVRHIPNFLFKHLNI